MSKVTVTAKAGMVVIPSKNSPEWGSVRVEQTRAIVENGFAKPRKVSAFIKGKIADLQALYTEGQTLPGIIAIKESFTPANPKNPDKSLKIAGETGVVCRVGSDAIHLNYEYHTNPEHPKAQDVFIEHTNGEEIKAANAKLEAANVSTPLDKA